MEATTSQTQISDLKTPDRLYNLLPLIYRQRDALQGYPLRALLQVMSEQLNLVEDDIDQLYDNWFIETCADWVVPYIGDLVGYRPVHEAGEPLSATASARARILSPRREVANTLRYRRRKGSLALLEELGRDAAGWPTRAVEFYPLLAGTQAVNHLQPVRGQTVDMRAMDALDRYTTPFDGLAHTIDVRRPLSATRSGRFNLPGVGLFVWRLKPYSIARAPAHCIDRVYNRYLFNILGVDTRLVTKPVAEPDPAHIAEELNVPAWIRRRALQDHLADYYGEDKSLYIWRDSPDEPVPLESIIVADLTDWAYIPPAGKVAVDPILGRISFPRADAPTSGVWVSYYYAFSADIGGGEYSRPPAVTTKGRLYRVRQILKQEGDYETIADALRQWQADSREQNVQSAVIEIMDSGEYTEQMEINLAAGQRLEIRAADGVRPMLRVIDRYSNRPDALRIRGYKSQPQNPAGAGARLVLDGLLITGRSVAIRDRVDCVIIRHTTLVPGWSLDEHCEPEHEEENSLELIDTDAQVIVEKSILGTIFVEQDEKKTDPIRLTIEDSILDSTNPKLAALVGPQNRMAHAELTVRRTTVIGWVRVHSVVLAENSIFLQRLRVARRQIGCVRFCSLTKDSRTPRRFSCQPDLALQKLKPGSRQADLESVRVRPQFDSLRYGTFDYARLSLCCADEIRRGADDLSEVGVYHDLYAPQRESNLRTRLEEYTPAGMDAGILFAS
jgi:hypothetical protein